MSLLQAILMGIIQGLTEFLPVSSSGHLAIFKILFGVDTDTGLLFDVLLHIGTLAAICIVYYKDVLKMIVEGIGIIRDCFINLIRFIGNKTGKTDEPYLRIVNSSYRKLVVLIIVSTIPTGIIGVVGKDVVEMASEILLIPGICLILTAVLLFIADHTRDGEKLPKSVTYTNAFLMSIPAILGALVLELKDCTAVALSGAEIAYYVVGMIVAAVVGYVCIKTMLIVVRRKKFTGFAIYCLIVGVISIGGYIYMA